jgi:hypothetical protein
MLKKVAIVGAAGLLTAAVLTQTKLGSFVCHKFDRAEDYLESKIPPEEELRQIRQEVALLDRDIDKARGSVAEERYESKAIKSDVEAKRTQVENSRALVEARGKMLKDAESSGSKTVKFDNRPEVPYQKALETLQAQVNAHRVMQKELTALEKRQAIREHTRELAEQHLQALMTQKAELETAVTEMDADIKLAKIEQVESKYQNDGTRMAEVKERLAKLKKRIAIQSEKLALAKQYDKSPVENKSVDEIMSELDSKDAKTTEVSKK